MPILIWDVPAENVRSARIDSVMPKSTALVNPVKVTMLDPRLSVLLLVACESIYAAERGWFAVENEPLKTESPELVPRLTASPSVHPQSTPLTSIT